jgi:hypothetical protein
MLQKWQEHGAITWAGYILGFPGDTKESIRRDVEIIKRELPLDILEFFFLTPLPGSEDHKVSCQNGVWMDTDMNKYDLSHRVSHHAKMSDGDWEEAYRMAWETYYTPEHMQTILRRKAATRRGPIQATLWSLLWFCLAAKYEGVHPLEAGAIRLKFRRDRRFGLPLESPFLFYPRYFGESLVKAWHYLRMIRSGITMLKNARNAPDRWAYSDLAIAPQQQDEFETLDLYRVTSGSQAALARKRRDETIRASLGAASS